MQDNHSDALAESFGGVLSSTTQSDSSVQESDWFFWHETISDHEAITRLAFQDPLSIGKIIRWRIL